MAVVNNQLTTIGGQHRIVNKPLTSGISIFTYAPCSRLLSLSRSSSEMKWEEFLPPMPTARMLSAAVTTPTHLIVAGGKIEFDDAVPVVETLDTNTLQWSSVSSSPEALAYPNMTLCNGQLYLSEHSKIFSRSVEELLKSRKSFFTWIWGSVWTKLTDIPVQYCASLTTQREQVLAIGGKDQLFNGRPTRAIHQYNRSTNSWSVIGEMPTPRASPLVAVLPSHELIVVGGLNCAVTEIASSTY